jgi:glycosyltransferase involved in cell wall biosynthesis
MDIFAGTRIENPLMTMHNITKIKLFRILLRITYLPSLLILYPFVLLRKKSPSGIFFFFDRYSLGGAQRIHLDILKAIPEVKKQVFFTRFSQNNAFRNEFFAVPNAICMDIHIWCDYLLFRLFSVHYYCFYINRHNSAQIFGANSTFFYDMLPFLGKDMIRTELLHNFTFGKNGMEFFGLKNHHLLTHRIIYDYYTRENIEKQYAEFHIDPMYNDHLLFIEPGVDIPAEPVKSFNGPLKLVCAGRGGPQKRIWLLNKIAEYCIDESMPVQFHFAGTLIPELTDKVKANSVIHGEITDPIEMSRLFYESDIAVLTSIYEGFPMFIKESMANGCIPLVTALPGNLMHLRDGYNSILIHELYDEVQLVQEAIEKIKLLISDKTLCKKLSQDSYRYARDHFSRQSFISSYRNLFKLPLVSK